MVTKEKVCPEHKDGPSTKEDVVPKDREADEDLSHEEYGRPNTGEENGNCNHKEWSGTKYLVGIKA